MKRDTEGAGARSAGTPWASTAEDPWRWQDPWSSAAPPATSEGHGGTDKIAVPEFSGEDDKDGIKARGYLRKIEAWRRVTRLRPAKQALMLYNSLTGRAWRDAEELDLGTLDKEDGVETFKVWIMEKYLDKEVVKVGKYLTEFFKTLKRGYQQDIREFNTEFDR